MKWKINNKKRFINFYFYIIKLFYSKGLLLLRFFLLISLFFTSLFADEKKINILVLHSFQNSLPWTQEVNKGLEEVNKKYNNKVNYYMVYLDFLRVGKQISPQDWEKHIREKYKKIKFDGIYANGVYAINLIKTFGDDFAPNVPKIYNDTNAKANKNELNLSINRAKTVSKTLDLAFELNPNAKKIYTIDGVWEDTKYLNKLLPEKLKKFPNIKHERIHNYSYDELFEKVKNIEKDSFLVAAIVSQDKNMNRKTPISVIRKISELNKNVPIFSFLTTHLQADITGGYMFNGSINAITAVEAILDYNKNNMFTKKYEYAMHTYINWRHLKRFQIDYNKVPDDAIILNKPKSVFESYYYEAISTAVFIFFLILILICLLYLVYKLKDTNIKLQMETEEKIEKEKLLTQQTKTALMGEMISNIAHQWRQPLNRINSNIAVIDIQNMRLDINDEKIENSLQNIEKQTHYMSQTIDDFFQFISDDKEKEEFYLVRPINKALELLSTRLVNIKVEINIDESIKIVSYENEFAQVILSLINNALDIFKINKLGAPAISIDVKKVEDEIFIEISDNGGGIKDEIIHKIFDANFSTKTNTKASGLGLYISKNIIENSMKGSIEAFNNEKGASFKITLKA